MNLPRFHQDIQNYNIDLSSYLPAISEETMLAHYQHYNKYCNNLLIATESASTKYPNLRNLSLNEIVKHYFCDSVIYNNAAQVLNHQIYSHYNIFSQYLYIFKDFHKKYTFMY